MISWLRILFWWWSGNKFLYPSVREDVLFKQMVDASCSLWDKDYGKRRATMDTIRMPGSQGVHCVPYPCMCLLMLIVLTYTCILNNTLIFAGFGHGRQNKTLDRIPLALASSLTYTTWSDGQRAYSHIHVIVSKTRPAKMRTSMHMLLHCSVVRLAQEDSMMNMVEITARIVVI